MKKESLKYVLYAIIAVSIVSLIIGTISHIFFLDGFNTYSDNMEGLYQTQQLSLEEKQKLMAYFLPCIIITILIVIFFLSLIFTKYIKNNKARKITLFTILTLISLLAIASIVVARLTLKSFAIWYNYEKVYAYNYVHLQHYETNLANVLNVSVSAIILAAALMILLIINNKEEKQQKEIETQQNNNSSNFTTAE